MKQEQHSRENGQRALHQSILLMALILIPVLVYAPTFGGNTATPPGEEAYSDLLITHYPNLLYLRKSILVDHQIPLWSTMIQSGSPFAANPLAGLFYLPGWLAMLFPLPAGLSLMVAAHAVFGTWGMYKFLGQREVSQAGRIAGALGFGLMPKFGAHFGAGHITLLYALAWTPWLLYCSHTDRQGWTTGVIAGALFLADPRWSIYAGTLWLTYHIAHRQLSIKKRLGFYLRAAGTALVISAPLILPLVEYVQLSTRAGLSAADMLTGSLPVQNLINIIIPASGGNLEWYFYAGGAIIGLVISQLFVPELRKQNRFWYIWGGLSILLALGTSIIPQGWINRIPIFNLLRVPARSLFLAGICAAVIAGTAIEKLFNEKDSDSRKKLAAVGILGFGLLMMAGAAFLAPGQPLMIFWGFTFFALSGLLLFIGQLKIIRIDLKWIVVGVLVLDLAGASLYAYEIVNQNTRDPDPELLTVINDADYFRIYSPSYTVDQYLAAEYGLELADGVDPMQIANYVDFIQEATGVPQEDYSVTIPPFSTGDPSHDNEGAQIDSRLLGLLNVKYVVSEFSISEPGLSTFNGGNGLYIYENVHYLPRAWIEYAVGDRELDSRPDPAQVEILSKTANNINLTVEGPGRVVLSEIQYPGWQVYVDGERQEIDTAYEILRSVSLPEGQHQVQFKFRPISVMIGLVICGLGWIFLVWIRFGDRFEDISAR